MAAGSSPARVTGPAGHRPDTLRIPQQDESEESP
jgi:hypothetical protein